VPSMRRIIAASATTVVLLLAMPRDTAAAEVRHLCSFTRGAGPMTPSNLHPPSTFARAALQAILGAVDEVGRPIEFGVGPVQNAAAMAVAAPGGGLLEVILYNEDFMEWLQAQHSWAAVSVLAHEVGHHLDGHATISVPNDHPWRRELAADWLSGCALRNMNAPLSGATAAMHAIRSRFGSGGGPSHPPVERRERAIEEGWSACGG